MYAPVSSHMNFHVWVMLIVLSILWGTSFIFTEIALEDFRPLTIATLRVSGAASALWIYLLIIGAEIPRSLSIWGAFLIMGIVNNAIPFAAIMFAQTLISASLASILNSTAPLFTVVLAGILLSDERITTARIFAVILGFIGVVVMIGPPALLGIGADVLAQCAVLGASVSYAFSAVFARRFKAMGLQPSVLAVGMLTMSSLCLAPVAIFFDRPFTLNAPGISSIAAAAGVALLSTALAYILYFRILAAAGATNLLLVTFLIPVSAILLGVNFLGESLSLSQIVGMFLIGLGLAVMDGRIFKRRS